MKITRLKVMMASTIVTTIVTTIVIMCFYCWPSKVGVKTCAAKASVQKTEAQTGKQKTYSVSGQVGLSLEK